MTIWLIFIGLISLQCFAIEPAAKIRLKVGEEYSSDRYQVKMKLNRFHTTKTECAVPGFNCGSGYTPEPVTTPILDFQQTNPECSQSPRPKNCEWTFKIVGTDSKSFVEIEILNIYDFCMKETDKSNRNSCILRTTVGNHFNPMHSPDNCNKADDIGVRNDCFEMMAENLNDPKLCKNVVKPHGRRCILILAKASKDPAVCLQMKTAYLNGSEQNERKLFEDRCLEEIKRLKNTN